MILSRHSIIYTCAGLGIFGLSLATHALQNNELESVEKCREITDDADRLACYDSAFENMASLKDTRSQKKDLERALKEANKRAEKAEKELRKQQGQQDDPAASQEDRFGAPLEQGTLTVIESTIVDFRHSRSGKARIRLENGQIWDTKEKVPAHALKKGIVVRIKRGAIRSFRMTFIDRGVTVRASRYVKS